MTSPLATYQRTCPKIVWARPSGTTLVPVYTNGFESYATTAAMLADWTEVDPSGTPGNAVWTLDTARRRAGAKAAKLTLNGPVTNGQEYAIDHVVTGLVPGGSYVFQRAIYAIGGSPSFGEGAWFEPVSTRIADGTGQVTLRLELIVQGDGTAVNWQWWFDEVRLSHAVVVAGAPATLDVGYPLAKARSWSPPSPGSVRVLYPSGASAAWLDESDAVLEGTVIGIPPEDGDSPFAPATGWNGDTGWQAFLEWAWAGGVFDFWRDRDDAASALTCQLLEPRQPPTPGPAGTRQLILRLRSATTARFGGY